MPDCRRLAIPIGVSVLNRHDRLVAYTRTVREPQREGLHGPVERAPDVDEPHAGLEQLFCFGGEMVAHAGFGGGFRLVNVDAHDGVAGCGGVGVADGVVEDEDAFGAGDVVEEGALDFGVVVRFDGGVGGEVNGGRGGGAEGGEGVGVEGEGLAGVVVAEVGDLHRDGGVGEIALGMACWGLLDIVEGFGAVGRGVVEREVGSYGAVRYESTFVALGSEFGGLNLYSRCGCGHGGFGCVVYAWCDGTKQVGSFG